MSQQAWQERPLEKEVQSYLDQLLREGTAGESPALVASAEQPRAGGMTAMPLAQVALAEPPTLKGPRRVVAAPSTKPPDQMETAVLPEPAWRQQEFEVLRFRVGGLMLAVPLVLLGSIHPLVEPPVPLPGQADWCLGVLPGQGAASRVVDTARVIMPERYRPELREGYRYVLTVHQSRWALAADAIAGTETLARQQVRWRTRAGRRPWLAGTVIDHLCALIDVAGLDVQLMGEGGQNSNNGGDKA